MARYLEYERNLDVKLKIDKTKVLRYLNYGNNTVDKITSSIIDNSIAEIHKISHLHYIYGVFDMQKYEEKILLQNSLIELSGKDIFKLLEDSKKLAVMAATLGLQVEQKIKHYSISDLTKGIIFDAVATATIEELCNFVEERVKKLACSNGYNITSRYSPGYGDLPISIQPQILTALNTQKLIGLSNTENYILVPRKSVTAIIGFTREKVQDHTLCLNCNMFQTCKFTRKEDRCAK